LLVTVVASLLCAAPLHAQLITNGALNANASGWTLGGGCGDEVWDGSVGNPSGSIRLNACGEATSDPTASQTINGLVVGTVYTISVDVHLHVNLSGGTGKSFGIFLNSAPSTPLLLTEFLDNSWHTVTTTFTASSNSATIIFAGELDARTPGGPGSTTDVSYYIDNISVTGASPPGVPAPSSVLLVLTGLLALLGWTGLRRLRASR
jgi:hypothetical protein